MTTLVSDSNGSSGLLVIKLPLLLLYDNHSINIQYVRVHYLQFNAAD